MLTTCVFASDQRATHDVLRESRLRQECRRLRTIPCNNYSVVTDKYRVFIAVAGPSTKLKDAIRLVKRKGTVRPRDLVACGIPADYLDRLRRRGVIEKVARGVYAWPDADVTEQHSLAAVARAAPAGVVCLLSALQFHGLTTQAPHEVWLAFPNKGWIPKVASPKIRVARFSGPALSEMIESHKVEGETVRVYTPAKTVADCFKFRSTVGLDVAIEALRDCWRKKNATMDELWAAARVCRMANVMRPYIESLV